VCAELEAEGYAVQPFVLPAAAVNAPHRRDRVWFVAYRNMHGLEQRNCHDEEHTSQGGQYAQRDTQQGDGDGDATDAESVCVQRFSNGQGQEQFGRGDWSGFPTQSPICGGDDGLPAQLDGITFPKWRAESIKGYGNAIVPQVALQIFKAIQQYQELQHES